VSPFRSPLNFCLSQHVYSSHLRATSPDGVAGTRGHTDGIADSDANYDTGGGLDGVRREHAWRDDRLSRGILSSGNRFSDDAAAR
jgi:hypothetical protein